MSWETHTVANVVPELRDYNVYSTDIPLQEAVRRAGAEGYESRLIEYGARLGSEKTQTMAEAANRFKPELQVFDRQGRRIDRVEYHPGWHGMMRMLREHNLVSLPFSDPHTGAWAAYAAGFSMHGQIEAGSQCPNSMTFASIPVLQKEPALFSRLSAGLFSRTYDARDIPLEQKASLLIGMGVTEKQGGSDVRANSTIAAPLGAGGRGGEYELTGHKWFFSAPMCDAHLVVARTPDGLSCFFVPRFRPDGSKNPVHIQRLKDKVGNQSNASGEVEFQGAWGRMVGEAGRGIPTIIEMATYTRLNCVMGSAGLIRQGLVQAIHHARERSAFGKRLADQPLMRNVLIDMALESEASTLLMMWLTEAYARADTLSCAVRRIVTPAAKLWVAKRSIELSAEAMEVIGGNGYMHDCPTGRLYREAPVISIWEGSGNLMALDMLRAINREPDMLHALLDDLEQVCGGDIRLQPSLAALREALPPGDEGEARARRYAQQLVLMIQARLMREHAPEASADAFIASRFDGEWGKMVGALPSIAQHAAILERAWPV